MDWFRWHHGAVSDDKWPLVARKSGQTVATVVAVWAALLECASQAENRGFVESFDAESIDALFGLKDGATQKVVAALSEGQKPRIANGRLVNWEKRQPRRERENDLSTERVRKHRELKKNANSAPSQTCAAIAEDAAVQAEPRRKDSLMAENVRVKRHETPLQHHETHRKEQSRVEKSREETNSESEKSSVCLKKETHGGRDVHDVVMGPTITARVSGRTTGDRMQGSVCTESGYKIKISSLSYRGCQQSVAKAQKAASSGLGLASVPLAPVTQQNQLCVSSGKVIPDFSDGSAVASMGEPRAVCGTAEAFDDAEIPDVPARSEKMDTPGMEFVELRDLYDHEGKAEAPLAGFIAYRALKKRGQFPGIARIAQVMSDLAAYDVRWQRGYRPNLNRFLQEQWWLRKIEPASEHPEKICDKKKQGLDAFAAAQIVFGSVEEVSGDSSGRSPDCRDIETLNCHDSAPFDPGTGS